jgi:kinesin family protein C1
LNSSIAPRLKILEEERSQISAEIASKKEEILSLSRENHHLRESLHACQMQLVEKESEAAKAKTLLEVEREIRQRCESKEEFEKTERIAACAQLLATQTDCTHKIRYIEEKLESERIIFEEKLNTAQRKYDEAVEQCRNYSDILSRKEGEFIELKKALQNAAANHEAAAELGRLKGEVEVLRRRVAEANETKSLEGSAAANRIRELEQQMILGDAQRRRLHNLVQELRGNVRVFARVRPFLPNDQVDESVATPTVAVAQDGVSLKIEKLNRGPDERAEEHKFAFDKVFGQSSSQV